MAKSKRKNSDNVQTTYKLFESISKVTITSSVSPMISGELLKYRNKINAKLISKL